MKNTPILTEEQVQTLRGALSGHSLESIVTLALVTGLRRNELLNLKWQDIDLSTCELRSRSTKTTDNVSLHIPADVAEMLTQHRVSQAEAKEKAGLTWVNLDLVFPDHYGKPLQPRHLVKGFYEVVEQAGLPCIRFHDLRRHVKSQELKKREVSRE